MGFHRFPCPFGKYLLLDLINTGGMAEVYRAKMTGAEQFQRSVAIKCILPELHEDREFTTMFVDEAKLAAQLSHANIAQIYELGRVDQQLYIAMELVNGRDLRDLIRRATAKRQPIPVGFAAYVMHKTADALDFAHRKADVDGKPLSLVHRDVSPQNILISYDGEVKVVDFGIAKAEIRDTKTKAGVIKGKFSYLAPEQVTGDVVDHRADIFALGAVFYETLTGKRLFQGQDDISTLDRVRAAHVPALAETRTGLSEELDTILRCALGKQATDRYAWSSEFAEALAPFLIEDKSLFGARQARAFMQSLYSDEVAALAERLPREAKITLADCSSSGLRWANSAKTQIFQCAADLPDLAPPAFAVPQGDPYEQATQAMVLPKLPPMSQIPSITVPSEPELPRPMPAPRTSPRFIVNMLLVATVMVLAAVIAQLMMMPGKGLASAVSVRELQGKLSLAWQTTAQAAAPTVLTPVATTQAPANVEAPAALALAEAVREAQQQVLGPHVGDDQDADFSGDESRASGTAKGTRRHATAAKVGFMNVKVDGVRAARIFVDGEVAGYAPLIGYRVPCGKHRLRVVEEDRGMDAREKIIPIRVTSKHQQQAPLEVRLQL